jgi:predicted DCC family thiol-disulfide oxidoreductase YuxK
MTTATQIQRPTAAGELALPRPEDVTNPDVVIYDGHCSFCRARVKQLAWLDRSHRLAFLSLHDPEVKKRYPDLTYDQLMKEMYVVDRKGGRHAGAAAFRYLSRHLPLLFPIAPLMHIPFSMPLWQALYGLVARNRYLFGKTAECEDGACKLHR